MRIENKPERNILKAQMTKLCTDQGSLRQALKYCKEYGEVLDLRSQIMRNRLGTSGLRALNNRLRNSRHK